MKLFDEQFQSMKEKLSLSEREKREILAQVNEKIAQNSERSQGMFKSWKYVGTFVTAFALIFVISFSFLQQDAHSPTGDSYSDPSTPVANIEETEEKLPQSLVEAIDKLLPADANLISPKKTENTKSIQFYDFDNDGSVEVVLTYEKKGEVENSPQQFGVIVLKKKADSWEKAWEKEIEGVGLNYFQLVDVTNDGTKELIFGVTIGASVGNQLEIFTWEKESFEPIFETYYHELEIVKNERVGLAIWDRFLADTYFVEVVRWNGNDFVIDQPLFAAYYPKIASFYEEKLLMMNAWFYWYALADAQIKANLMEEAKSSIQNGIEIAEKEQLSDALENLQKLKDQLKKKEL